MFASVIFINVTIIVLMKIVNFRYLFDRFKIWDWVFFIIYGLSMISFAAFEGLFNKQIEGFEKIDLKIKILLIVTIIIILSYLITRFLIILKNIGIKEYVNNWKMSFVIGWIQICPIVVMIFIIFFERQVNQSKFSFVEWMIFLACIFVGVIIGNFVIIIFVINKFIYDETLFNNIDFREKIKLVVVCFFILIGNFSMTIYISVLLGGESIFHNVNSFFDSVYFAIITITTVGYGVSYPSNCWAKLVTMAYSLATYYLVIIGVTRIVSSNAVTKEEFINNPKETQRRSDIIKNVKALNKMRNSEKNIFLKFEYWKAIKQLVKEIGKSND